MTIPIDVWSDFVCPWCYAASLSLNQLAETEDVSIRWRAYELRPAGSPPMDPAYREHIETNSRPRFNAMMKAQFGLEIREGPFGIDSRLALIADKYAEAQGNRGFNEAVKRAYWLEGQDISQLSVLRSIAEGVGLDGAAFEAVVGDPAARAPYDVQVTEDVRTAAAYGLQGVPAIVFAKRYLVPGAVPVETLREVLADVKRETAEA